MRRGGSRYVREDATSSVQLAGRTRRNARAPLHAASVHRERIATTAAAATTAAPEIICPPENNRVAVGTPTGTTCTIGTGAPYRPSYVDRYSYVRL